MWPYKRSEKTEPLAKPKILFEGKARGGEKAQCTWAYMSIFHRRVTQPSGKGLVFASGSKGFTLIELLVVLILIGIFSSLVFVAVASGILRSEENRFIQSFSQTLVRARSASLGRGEAVRFFIDGENRAFCVEGLKWQNIPESIKIEGDGVGEVEPGIYAVTFYPDGSSSGGEIDLKWEGGRMDRIVIDRFLGLIRMERI